jgi:formate--tetrahydrofolate ligase
VIVATVRATKYHGGVEVADLPAENIAAIEKGSANLIRHLGIVRDILGLPAVVAINHRAEDTDAEIAALVGIVEREGARAVVARHFAEGSAGAEELAHEVVRLCDEPSKLQFVYPDDASLWTKMKTIATRVYGASDITATTAVRAQIRRLQEEGYGDYPICVAKTQYSSSTDAKLRGAPTGHVVEIREVRLAAGARFVVMVCGAVMTMPGLPVVPAAASIDVDENGRIVGLF